MNKKAELTSKQLITIIILIVSFAIILAFFLMINLGGDIDKEACRNSVMMAQIPFAKYVVSLKCQTQDVCLSMGSGCGEKVDETIKVANKEELIEKMVNLLADCWWMMGEGKVDYDKVGSCAICYKVYFDEEIKKQKEIDYNDLFQYIKEEKLLDGNYEKMSSERFDPINLDEPYVVITKIISETEHFPPVFIKFDADELKKEMKCSKYVTEI